MEQQGRRTITVPPLYPHCLFQTITVPSLHHPCTITAPSLSTLTTGVSSAAQTLLLKRDHEPQPGIHGLFHQGNVGVLSGTLLTYLPVVHLMRVAQVN